MPGAPAASASTPWRAMQRFRLQATAEAQQEACKARSSTPAANTAHNTTPTAELPHVVLGRKVRDIWQNRRIMRCYQS
jgi:hypothetical protein